MDVNSGSFTLFANLLGIIGIILAVIVSILFVYLFIWICIFAYRIFTPLVEYLVQENRAGKAVEDELQRPRDRRRYDQSRAGEDVEQPHQSQSTNYLLSLVHRL